MSSLSVAIAAGLSASLASLRVFRASLTVSVAFLIQPFFAVLFGYLTNLGSAPTLLTLFAAPLLVGGSGLVTIAQRGVSFSDLFSCFFAN
jgi:hypothetical protein